MKKLLQSRLPYLFASFSLIFLLSGQAVAACLLPIMMEMSEDQAMACCTQDCRMEETAPQAAQKACEQSRTVATHPDQAAAGPSLSLIRFAGKDLPPPGACSIHNLSASQFISSRFCSNEPSLFPPYHTVKLYLLIQSFLI